jgi:hypothetical protein
MRETAVGLWVPELGRTGASLFDIARGNTGAINDGVTWDNQSLLFGDIAGAWVDGLSFPAMTRWSVLAYCDFDTSASATIPSLIGRTDATGTSIAFRQGNGQQYLLYADSSNSNEDWGDAADLAGTRTWLWSFDGTTARLGRDGVVAIDTPDPGKVFDWALVNAIGTSGSTRRFKGYIHSVSVFNRVITDSEFRLFSNDPDILTRKHRTLVPVSTGAAPPTGFEPWWARQSNTLLGSGV